MNIRIKLLAFLCIYVLAGCGGGGGNNSISRSAQIKTTINWGSRTRGLSSPSSALSAVITLTNAAPNGGDVTLAPVINRDATKLEAYSQNYSSTNQVKVGTWPLHAEFHSQPDGMGDIVGTVDANVTIAEDGTGIGELTTTGTVGTVTIDPNQKVLVGSTKTLTFSVKDTSTPPKLLAVTAGSASFSTQVNANLDVSLDGIATGFDVGTAPVTVTVDNKTSVAENVEVVYPGGGLLRSISAATNDGNAATIDSVEGNMPTDGSLPAPDLSRTTNTVVRGGSVILSVVTPQPVDALLIGVANQPNYYRVNVGNSRSRAAKISSSFKNDSEIDGKRNYPLLITKKYPVLATGKSQDATRSAKGRASGVEYRVIVSVPSEINIPNLDINVASVLGNNNSRSASNSIAVNQTAQSSDSLQFTLSWSAPVDLDLHVATPLGEEIFYANRSDSSGGALDLDSNAGCSIDNVDNENITWTGEAPSGEYTVFPVLYAACDIQGSIPYVITINDNGDVSTYNGSISSSDRSITVSTSRSRADRSVKHQHNNQKIVVSIARQVLTAYEGETVKYEFDCMTGRPGFETPTGSYKIESKVANYHSREFDAPMPYAMFFIPSRGIAIHATSDWRVYLTYLSSTHWGSHGCVGLKNADAATLFTWAKKGTKVEINP